MSHGAGGRWELREKPAAEPAGAGSTALGEAFLGTTPPKPRVPEPRVPEPRTEPPPEGAEEWFDAESDEDAKPPALSVFLGFYDNVGVFDLQKRSVFRKDRLHFKQF